jgi:hypothetical protein
MNDAIHCHVAHNKKAPLSSDRGGAYLCVLESTKDNCAKDISLARLSKGRLLISG